MALGEDEAVALRFVRFPYAQDTAVERREQVGDRQRRADVSDPRAHRLVDHGAADLVCEPIPVHRSPFATFERLYQRANRAGTGRLGRSFPPAAQRASCGRRHRGNGGNVVRIAFIANPEAPGGWYRGIGPVLALGERGHDISQMWDAAGRHPRRARGRLRSAARLPRARRRGAADRQSGEAGGHDAGLRQRRRHARRAEKQPRRQGLRGLRRRPRAAADKAAAADVGPRDRLERADRGALPRVRRRARDRDRELRARTPRSTRPRRRTARPSSPAGWPATSTTSTSSGCRCASSSNGARRAIRSLVIETVGCSMGMRHERYRCDPHVDFFDLPRKLAQFDIGLAPIADIPFNHARSNIKVKEYAIARQTVARLARRTLRLARREAGRPPRAGRRVGGGDRPARREAARAPQARQARAQVGARAGDVGECQAVGGRVRRGDHARRPHTASAGQAAQDVDHADDRSVDRRT